MKNKEASKLGKLSQQKTRERMGEKAYKQMMKDKSKKAAEARQKFSTDDVA